MSNKKAGPRNRRVVSKAKKRLRKLQEAEENVLEALKQNNYRKAGKAVGAAHEHAVKILESAIQVAHPTLSEAPVYLPFDVILGAEKSLGVKAGTFEEVFQKDLEISALLTTNAVDDLKAILDNVQHQRIPNEVCEVPGWLPTLIKIASAVVVGTVVAAPLSALAVNESVSSEVVKTAVVSVVLGVHELTVGSKIDQKFRKRN